MSRYLYYDHAGWVQDQITATKNHKPTKREWTAAKEERKGWYAAPDKLNHFQKRAINLIGIVGGGIYNCQIGWPSVIWWQKQIILPWYGSGFGTWDFQHMTLFAFLCHKARMRGYIAPCNQRYLKVFLSERSHKGGIASRHPNLEEALAEFNEWYPHEHMITYPGDKEQFLTGSRHSAVWPELGSTLSQGTTSYRITGRERLALSSVKSTESAARAPLQSGKG